MTGAHGADPGPPGTETPKDVNAVHYYLFIKARSEELQRQAERSRQRRESRDARRGR